MAIRDLMPWKTNQEESSLEKKSERDPLVELQRDMNRLFEDFFKEPFAMTPFSREKTLGSSFTPQADISETEGEITVSLELPGMEADQIDLSFHNNTLTISGEKHSETEEEGSRYYRKERTYGSFRRSIPLPGDIDEDAVEASFKNGVLKVQLPKSESAQDKSQRITITTD